ncbi:DNA-protecting protein DprA [Parvibaculum sedimenti]|uniref:DNA-protecting protein DprA n=2 Tax=Parvibaculum sedimenti TaxID=2608632 RepID=A0A6N6VHF4_9HYPH|nr:DNA-processing protein DprA [Parvibaculum sedimenti]KAB7740191.1 DNA-protecting protein DprA [Parvibaculum sedimenti]
MSAPLSAAERLARLRLARSDTVGPVTFRDLLQHFPNAVEALDALPSLAARGGRKSAPRIPSRAEAEREIAATEKLGARLIVFGESDFPRRLAAVDPAPPVISVLGSLHLAERPAIALVGSRNASAAGAKLASTIARDLGQRGYTTVSGLARGIDAAAHKASLDTGTIGVVAGGLDVVYPEENRALQLEIAERGALISEMPPGTRPQARHFPRRNRLISGLSLAVVVVEAAMRSGSLITARFALEQGRDVFAVPGSPLDPRARGSNSLIKDGAALVESADDIIAALAQAPMLPFSEPAPDRFDSAGGTAPEPDAATRKRVLSALGPTPTPVDEILRMTGASVPVIRMVLLELDLAGRLHRDPGDRVSLLPEGDI